MLGRGVLGLLTMTVAAFPLQGVYVIAIPRDILSAFLAQPPGVAEVELSAVLARARSTDAVPTILREHRIVRVELVAPHAARLSRVVGRQTYTPQYVGAQRDRLQVVRVHTAAVPAQMVKGQPSRHAADEHLVGEAMCVHVAALVPILAVPVVGMRLPIPAAAHANLHLLAESGGQPSERHSGLALSCKRPNRSLNNGRLGQSQTLREPCDESDALWREPVAGSEFLGHVGNVPLAAVGVK